MTWRPVKILIAAVVFAAILLKQGDPADAARDQYLEQIQSLLEQISITEKYIGSRYRQLADIRRVNEGKSVINLMEEVHTNPPGVEDSYFIESEVVVFWENEKPARFEVNQREAKVHGIHVIRRVIQTGLVGEKSGEKYTLPRYNAIVTEIIESGRGDRIIFRLPVEGQPTTDTYENAELDEVESRFPVVYMTNLKDQINILRDYRDALNLLDRRMIYLIQAHHQRDRNDFERLMYGR